MATTSVGIDKETGLSLYRTMQVIRQCEERLAKSHQQGLGMVPVTYVGEGLLRPEYLLIFVGRRCF